MYTKEDVAAVIDHIGALKIDPAVEMGAPDQFGLGLELFDPLSGQIITVARPHRADIGQPELLLTAGQVVAAVGAARTSAMHALRAAGFASFEEAAEARKRDAEARDLAVKQAAERDALNTTHAEATASAAADAQAKSRPADAQRPAEPRPSPAA